jgi:DNA-binding transcriptional regulator/RsmH inhibitor MraZ
LREAAATTGEVDVQGRLNYLEIWNHARFLEQMNRNPMTAEDEKALDDLGI